MLSDTERMNVSDFFHDDEEFDLFSAALYFQRTLIFNMGFDQVKIRMNQDEGEVFYSVTVIEPQEFVREKTGETDRYDAYFYLVLYRDYINIQTSVNLDLFPEDAEKIGQRAQALTRRATYLKGLESGLSDRELLFYSWVPVDGPFDSQSLLMTVKDHVWFFAELNRYIKTLSAGRDSFGGGNHEAE